MTEPVLQIPQWTLPYGIHAFVSTRQGGVSKGAWRSLDLGLHVQDVAADVVHNRDILLKQLQLHTRQQNLALQWVQQVHGTQVHVAAVTQAEPPQADAIYTRQPGIVCGVLTADCLPVLFCARDGSEIAVAHAGWRGLVAGVLESTLQCFASPPESIMAWLGPAIGPCHFEVGAEVREAFIKAAGQDWISPTSAAFRPAAQTGKFMADLYALARIRLSMAGIVSIAGQMQCTVCDPVKWYSYRRDALTGRFATMIVRTQ